MKKPKWNETQSYAKMDEKSSKLTISAFFSGK
jgi:hypothetical protein